MTSKALMVNAAELLRRPGTERTIATTLTTAELGLGDQRFRPDDTVTANIRLESLSDGIVVLGSVHVPWRGTCRRCLRELSEQAVCEVDELYQSVVTNPNAFEIVGDQLDLIPMVRELALLDTPTAPLCRPDCAGLCSVCGTDLNELQCSCEAPALGSPWDVLDQLKGRLDAN